MCHLQHTKHLQRENRNRDIKHQRAYKERPEHCQEGTILLPPGLSAPRSCSRGHNGQTPRRQQGSAGQTPSERQAGGQAVRGGKREPTGLETWGIFNLLLLFGAICVHKGEGGTGGKFLVAVIQRREKTKRRTKCKN